VILSAEHLVEKRGIAAELPERIRQGANGSSAARKQNKKSDSISLINEDKTGVIARMTTCPIELRANIEALVPK